MSETVTTEAPASADEADYAGIMAEMREADAAPQAPEAPAPEAAPEPQPQPEAKEPEQDEKRRRGLIAELQEERAARKQLAEELKALREERKLVAALKERMDALQQPPKPEIPDFQTNPADHLKAGLEMTQQELAQLRQERQAQAAREQFLGRYRAAVSEVAAELPDFSEAYKHAVSQLQADAALYGIPAEAIEAQIVTAAFDNGRNPARALYDFAKQRGYAKPAPAAEAQKTIETIERGVNASRGVAATAGQAPRGGLTLQALAEMSPSEFAKVSPATVRRLLGGDDD